MPLFVIKFLFLCLSWFILAKYANFKKAPKGHAMQYIHRSTIYVLYLYINIQIYTVVRWLIVHEANRATRMSICSSRKKNVTIIGF